MSAVCFCEILLRCDTMNEYTLWLPFIGVCVIVAYVVVYGLLDFCKQKKRIHIKEAIQAVDKEVFAFFGGKRMVFFSVEDRGDSTVKKFQVEYQDEKLILTHNGVVVKSTEYQLDVLGNAIHVYYDNGVRVLVTPKQGAASVRLVDSL